MELYTPLRLSEQENLNIGESHVLRYGPAGIVFYNRDHDHTNSVSSAVPNVIHAFWLNSLNQLLVQNEAYELHLLDVSARQVLKIDSLGSELRQVGVIDSSLFALADDSIMKISLKDKEQACLIHEKLSTLNSIILTKDHHYIGIYADRYFTIYNSQGSKSVTFKRINFSPVAARCLEDGSWLTTNRKGQVDWWSSDGTEIATFPFQVNIYDGVRLLESGNLICTDGELVIFEVSPKGNIASKYVYSPAGWTQKDRVNNVAKGLHEIIRCLAVVEDKSINNQQLTKFTHNYNVIGFSVDQVEDESGKLVIGMSPKHKSVGNPWVWNFFYRPNERTLRNQLVDEMRSISNVDDILIKEEEALSNLKVEKRQLGARKRSLFFIFAFLSLTSLAGSVWYSNLSSLIESFGFSNLSEPVFYVSTILFGLLSIVTLLGSLKAFTHAREISDSLNIFETIKAQTVPFKTKVKNYRDHLFNQIPQIGVERPSDTEMSEHVQSLISGKIRKVALDECGLDESDINSFDSDGNEIRTYINEPGYLQFSDLVDNPRAICPTNLLSFYLGPDNKPIFAVQFIQYFFLCTNKIDAFTCFYDFINDEMIANQSHTFYYRDVTNIGKRQVDFTEQTSGAKLNNARLGVEMKLVVASGDTIRINIATEETYRVMNKDLEDHAERESHNRINSINDEIHQIEQNTDLSEEEKAEEIKDLKEKLVLVEQEFSRRIEEHDSTHTETSQLIIQHIRGRLKELKEA